MSEEDGYPSAEQTAELSAVLDSLAEARSYVRRSTA
jgi:hypothetical protein